MQYLALTIPHYGIITPPPNIPSGDNASPSTIISWGISILFTVGIVAALIFIIYGGILWITSQGDKTKLDHARRTIIYAIVGMIVMILSFTIIRIVGYLLASDYLQNFGR